MSDDTGPNAVERIAEAARHLTDAELGQAVRALTADHWTQQHPDALVSQLVGWLESAVPAVAS